MLRQRLRIRTSPVDVLGRLVTLAFALALIWYGLMTLLVAVKTDPSTVNALSGYRTVFDYLGGLRPGDIDDTQTRAILAASGVAGFLVFGYLAIKQLPRPYLARHDLELSAQDRGAITVEPRAIERLAEVAATANPAVIGARGRYGTDDLTVDVTVRRARDLAGTLRDAQVRVVRALDAHQLPAMPVNVILTGYERRQTRELQ